MIFKTTTEFNNYISEVHKLISDFGEYGAYAYLIGEGVTERQARQFVIQARNHTDGSNHV